MNSITTLYLKPSIPTSVPLENLFRKFCPSLKGTLVVNLTDNKFEILNSGFTRSHDALHGKKPFVQQIIDPKGKLKHLMDADKIIRFVGNVSVDEAQVVFLDDSCHGDKKQALIRGEIVNALKGEINTLLCEGYGTETMYFSEEVFNQFFAPNLDYDLKQSLTAGWDDTITHKASLEKVRNGIEDVEELEEFVENSMNNLGNRLQSVQLSSDSMKSPEDFMKAIGFDMQGMTRLLTSVSKVTDVTGEDAHNRTVSQWNAIQKFRTMFPDSKIFVFGGSGHNNEPWLLDQLQQSGLKYCILTPARFIEFKDDKEAFQYAKNYYLGRRPN